MNFPIPLLHCAQVSLLVIVTAAPCAGWIPGTVSPLAVDGFSVDSTSRRDVLAFYQCIYKASENYAANMTWTGNVATCTPGSTSTAYKNDVRRRINFYRAMAGLPGDIVFDDVKTAKCQQAASMFSRNNNISHNPPNNWSCYTADADEAAEKSNIAYGTHGPQAVDAFMVDDGNGNQPVGHRRWFLYSRAQEMATGDIPANSTYPSTNAIWVIGNPKPAPVAKFIPWPNAGFIPEPLVPERWSLSYPGATFGSANVTVTLNGNPVSTTVISNNVSNVGDNTIVWSMTGLPSTVTNDVTYQVNVTGIGGGGPSSHSYSVTLFNPDILGEITTLSGPSTCSSSGTTLSVGAIAQADDYQVMVSRASTAAWTEGAEDSPIPQITENISAGYTLRQTTHKRTGAKAFQLTFPSGVFADQSFTVTRTVIPAANSFLTYYDRARFSTTTTTLTTQISTNGGATWTNLTSRNGVGLSSGNFDGDWILRSINIGSYAGQIVQFRFLISGNGQSISQGTTSNHGFFIDDITVTNSTHYVGNIITNLGANQTNFTLNATSAGESLDENDVFYLRARPNVGTRWFDYGAVKTVTIVAPTPYEAWIAGFPGAAAQPGFTQDADSDGIPNGVEHILGTSPAANTTGLYQVTKPANALKFRHSRSNSIGAGITHSYQWSTNLTNWHSSGQTNAGGTNVTIATTTITDTAAPSLDVIEVTATVNSGPNVKLFVRLAATQ